MSGDIAILEPQSGMEPPPENLHPPDLNCDKHWPPLSPRAQKTPCPYNLRSLGNKADQNVAFGGLDRTSIQGVIRGKRGRKSDISKAKLKAKLDVADGKQVSILGALRAVQTPEQVKK